VFYVYVLRNDNGRFYVGQTEDLERRLGEHDAGLTFSTRNKGPWRLVHYEEVSSRAEAMARERQLKSGRASQEMKRRLAQAPERVLPGKD
jgi:predicted GIY-YIG superfamily endonuclease